MESLNIVHEVESNRFTTMLEGYTATLDYRPVNDTVLEYSRTYVPPQIRHRGVARALTNHALAFAVEHEFSVIPSCWFVAKVLRERPEFAALKADV